MNEKIERSFNVGILGENSDLNKWIGQAFGAPGTRSDIQFYNRLDDQLNYIFCAVSPVEYPEKIKPLLQTLTLTDIFLLIVDLNVGLNSVIGELLIAIDIFCQLYHKQTIIIFANIKNNEWKLANEIKKLRQIIHTTTLKDAKIFELHEKKDFDKLKQEVIELGLKFSDQTKKQNNNDNSNSNFNSYTKILIDHVFPVKGIGTVALAVIKQGVLKKGQMLELIGFNGPSKKVVIKNIQKQDRDFTIAYQNDRVGLVLKGIKPNQIDRNFFLATPEIFKKESNITAEFHMNEFYKSKGGKITPGDERQYYALVNMRISPIKFTEGEDIYPGNSTNVSIQFSKSVFHDGSGLKGIIVELIPFEKKNRIVGHFKQSS
ncbi:MAG: Elongation factor Tu [Promethearchaeota archaeon]|nr:MAG: Elongation factor Tu [Candidatus Lokiarchaeota archaeon]